MKSAKKYLALLLALLMAAALSACGTKMPPEPNPPAPGEGEATLAAPPIEELYSEDFDYTDRVGNTGAFSCHVPKIAADTPGAADINRAIAETFTPIMDNIAACVEEGYSMWIGGISWKSYRYEDILSLVISSRWESDVEEYHVYLYDIAGQRQLTTPELLAQMGIEEGAFLSALRAAAADFYDNQYGSGPNDFQGDAFWQERREWTLSDENIHLNVSAYPDEAGRLYVPLPIGSVAGADSYVHLLQLDLLP